MARYVAPEIVVASDAPPPYMRVGPPGRYGNRRRVFFIEVHGSPRPAKVDAFDYGRAMRVRWRLASTGYPVGRIPRGPLRGRKVAMHSYILGARKGFVIDHLNGDRFDCRRSNLCHRPPWQNLHNVVAYRSSQSGIRGVCPTQRGGQVMWKASLGFRYKSIWLALCREKDEARRIIDLGIALLYGRGTRLTHGEPFTDSHVPWLVAEAAGVGPRNLRRVLARTAGHGDSLSARLREELTKGDSAER